MPVFPCFFCLFLKRTTTRIVMNSEIKEINTRMVCCFELLFFKASTSSLYREISKSLKLEFTELLMFILPLSEAKCFSKNNRPFSSHCSLNRLVQDFVKIVVKKSCPLIRSDSYSIDSFKTSDGFYKIALVVAVRLLYTTAPHFKLFIVCRFSYFL